MDSKTENKKYSLMNAKIYAKRFSTDCFSDYFNGLARRSQPGLQVIPNTQPKRRVRQNCGRKTVILSFCCTEVDHEKM